MPHPPGAPRRTRRRRHRGGGICYGCGRWAGRRPSDPVEPSQSLIMLIDLSIRDVVLIDQLALRFAPGLAALTGETGAGKSILLDALGLALGARGDAGLVRHGTSGLHVSATFDLGADHAARAMLQERDIPFEDDLLVLRRTVSAEGRSRAYVNDAPVGVGLLRALGDLLVEVHGQFDTHGLMDPKTHLSVLDAFAGTALDRDQVAAAWRAWRQVLAALSDLEAGIARARSEESFLRHAVEELDTLDPKPGEEAALAERRQYLMNVERLAEAVTGALDTLAGEPGAESAIGQAARRLLQVADKAGGRLDPAMEALDRAGVELGEAIAALQTIGDDLGHGEADLEAIEERLFSLRGVARKHQVDVDDLAALREALAGRLALIEDQGDAQQRLVREAELARDRYHATAATLTARRQEAAAALDAAVATELAPLKLDKARFVTRVAPVAEGEWGPDGIDRVAFEVATNPGAPPGPLSRIASGGELARFMLALKVVLATNRAQPGGAASGPQTLVFDEVDTGIGGAVAAAVGDRLARLGERFQVLVVTHSPQVAAAARHHFRVLKRTAGTGHEADRVSTEVVPLGPVERREEVARMLAGEHVTDEARAAAGRLLSTPLAP